MAKKDFPTRDPRPGYKWVECTTCNREGEIISGWSAGANGRKIRCPRCFRLGWVQQSLGLLGEDRPPTSLRPTKPPKPSAHDSRQAEPEESPPPESRPSEPQEPPPLKPEESQSPAVLPPKPNESSPSSVSPPPQRPSPVWPSLPRKDEGGGNKNDPDGCLFGSCLEQGCLFPILFFGGILLVAALIGGIFDSCEGSQEGSSAPTYSRPTSTWTRTPTPAVTPTPTRSTLPTSQATVTPIVIPTPFHTITPIPMPSATPSPTASPTPTSIPTPTATPTLVPTAVPTAAPTPAPTTMPAPVPATTEDPSIAEIGQLQLYALELINADRAKHGVAPVALGYNPAAQSHAEDMVAHGYGGHWWSNGMKPYMVYTVTGGKSYASENVASSGWSMQRWQEKNCDSFLVQCVVPTPSEAIEELHWSMMYDDADSDWGHRDNILDEGHRAVNIGIAFNNRRVTFIQHFEGGDVEAPEPPSLAKDGTFTLTFLKVQPGLDIGRVASIYYDPLPVSMTAAQIDALDSYCLGGGATTRCGDPVVRILPPPGPGRYYSQLDDNEVVADVWAEDEDSFRLNAYIGDLVTRPGVYTVVIWKDSGTTRFSERLLALSILPEQ